MGKHWRLEKLKVMRLVRLTVKQMPKAKPKD